MTKEKAFQQLIERLSHTSGWSTDILQKLHNFLCKESEVKNLRLTRLRKDFIISYDNMTNEHGIQIECWQNSYDGKSETLVMVLEFDIKSHPITWRGTILRWHTLEAMPKYNSKRKTSEFALQRID